MTFLVINGPNLNMLGVREPDIYGSGSYGALCDYIEQSLSALGVSCEIFQSNHEGAIVDAIQSAYKRVDGVIINPAAYTHTSIAILDALKAVSIPCVEVHLSDVNAREDFRKISYAGMACLQTFAGHGFDGYRLAAEYLAQYLKTKP